LQRIITNDKASRADNILRLRRYLGQHTSLLDTTFGGKTSPIFMKIMYSFLYPVLEYKDGRNETIISDGKLKEKGRR
jgi:hypothetical protein